MKNGEKGEHGGEEGEKRKGKKRERERMNERMKGRKMEIIPTEFNPRHAQTTSNHDQMNMLIRLSAPLSEQS